MDYLDCSYCLKSSTCLEQNSNGACRDIELISENGHLIVEAKRGWVLPTVTQLTQYADRLVNWSIALYARLSICSPPFPVMDRSSFEGP